MSGMTDERRKEIETNLGIKYGISIAMAGQNESLKKQVRECLQEIDRLEMQKRRLGLAAAIKDELFDEREKLQEELRKARELLLSAGQWLVCDSDVHGDGMAELSSEIEDYLKC